MTTLAVITIRIKKIQSFTVIPKISLSITSLPIYTLRLACWRYDAIVFIFYQGESYDQLKTAQYHLQALKTLI